MHSKRLQHFKLKGRLLNFHFLKVLVSLLVEITPSPTQLNFKHSGAIDFQITFIFC